MPYITFMGCLRGAKPLFFTSPSPLKERDTREELKRGGASLRYNCSPFPLTRGRGIKGDGVYKN